MTSHRSNPVKVLRRWERMTRVSTPETERALASRWAALPDRVKTPAQMLGRAAVGCEGTHGVFPRCNLTCHPCYHSADANKVRVDGDHTLGEVESQMRMLREVRGPRAHAQLIGGEVSLLSPDEHAAALLAMRAAGREPMSMTHGDFAPGYLRALVTEPGGMLRLPRVSFAAHFDSLMRGRRGIPRPRSEAELHPFRRAFVQMFEDLRDAEGLDYYLAHNMTVTPDNLAEVAGVVREVRKMGYSMLSFQPAARVGDDRRWSPAVDAVGIDDVWGEIEAGLGQPVPWAGLQFGDPRCNRTVFGVQVGGRFVPVMEPASPPDRAARDRYFALFGGLALDANNPTVVVLRVVRALVSRPRDLGLAARWAHRFVGRAGGYRHVVRSARAGRVDALTLVVHKFMDADVVAPAWDLMKHGLTAADPGVREAQERLEACSYAMAHPETGEVVPACVQHCVLDPAENRQLRVLLPMPTRRDATMGADPALVGSGLT